MTGRRLKKIERILVVQERLHQIAEWKLAGIDKERAELKRGEEALVGALNDDQALHGLFVDAMARRLRKLAIESERVEHEHKLQTDRLFEEGLRLKHTERMTAKVRREYLEGLWKRGFADLIDGLVRNNSASLP